MYIYIYIYMYIYVYICIYIYFAQCLHKTNQTVENSDFCEFCYKDLWRNIIRR